MTDELTACIDALHRRAVSGIDLPLSARRRTLENLRRSIRNHTEEIYDALHADLHKSAGESYLTEVAIVLREIDNQLRHLSRYARCRRVSTPWALWPSLSRITRQPLGTVLIVAPWNYPFQLLLTPAIGALAAGNCVALKPSPASPATNRTIGRILAESLPADLCVLIEGGHETADALLDMPFDHIFFTGGPAFGRTVMRRAAERLIPVTLELGGKSPCIVDDKVDPTVAARRIVWGKLLNAGQTCVAPDYVLVHRNLKRPLLETLRIEIERAFGPDPRQHPDYPRIVHETAFDRLHALLDASHGQIVLGGDCDRAECYIAPTLIDDPGWDAPIMQEEIFGPILPVLPFDRLDEAIERINALPRSLALYYFGDRKQAETVLRATRSGSVCINDTVVQLANEKLPFGGIGSSGMGRYHGRASFDLFSNIRPVVFTPKRFDLPLRYAPYRSARFFRHFY